MTWLLSNVVIIMFVALVGINYYLWKKSKWSIHFGTTTALIWVIASFTFSSLLPSYIPKHEVKRLPPVIHDQKEFEIRDISLKPDGKEIRTQKLKDGFKRDILEVNSKD